MSDSMKLLEEKIGKAIELVDKLSTENDSFIQENEQLKAELRKLRIEMNEIEDRDRQKSEKVKIKLNAILLKLENFEQL